MIETFTHVTCNEQGYEEVVIELQKTLISRIFRRDHVLTFVKLPGQGWSHKKGFEQASDSEYLLIYSYLSQC